LDVYLEQSNLVDSLINCFGHENMYIFKVLRRKMHEFKKDCCSLFFLLVNHNHDYPKWWYLSWLSLYIIHLGSTLLCMTSENDWSIFCGHNNFVVINFVFSKDKFYKFHYISFFFQLIIFFILFNKSLIL